MAGTSRLVLSAALGAALAAGCAAPVRCGESLAPERLYNGVHRPVWVHVPHGHDLAIALLDPLTDRALAIAPCSPGRCDLAAILPEAGSAGLRGVRYAQLLSGGTPVGPALVLQPLLSPRTAALVEPASGRAYWIDEATGARAFDAKEGTVRFYSESVTANSGLRVYPEKRVIVESSLGEMEFAMRPDAAPNTAFNFLHLAEHGLYTDTVVHRVVAEGRDGHPFVIQFGDPTGTGDGTPGYAIDMEPTTLEHDFGVISMARDSEPNTNGCQVFVCLSREGTARLDGRYCAFGTLARGAEVVRAIADVPVVEGTDRPADPPRIFRVRTVDAPPRQPTGDLVRTGT